jgi:hypothetical protein
MAAEAESRVIMLDASVCLKVAAYLGMSRLAFGAPSSMIVRHRSLLHFCFGAATPA